MEATPCLEALPAPERRASGVDLDALNHCLARVEAPRIVRWAADTFGDGLVMTTSFGIHSAALLHMAVDVAPALPVVWVDTGYLPAETYRFADELSARLGLNLHVAQSPVSPARMEATSGRLWEGDVESLDRYDHLRKVEPLQRALRELGATAWMSGVRAEQTSHRAGLPPLARQGELYKVSPLLRWRTRDVHAYLKRHDLPTHPYFEKGYASVGDWHSSRPLAAGDVHERDTRFRGLKQECGIHLDPAAASSFESSEL